MSDWTGSSTGNPLEDIAALKKLLDEQPIGTPPVIWGPSCSDVIAGDAMVICDVCGMFRAARHEHGGRDAPESGARLRVDRTP